MIEELFKTKHDIDIKLYKYENPDLCDGYFYSRFINDYTIDYSPKEDQIKRDLDNFLFDKITSDWIKLGFSYDITKAMLTPLSFKKHDAIFCKKNATIEIRRLISNSKYFKVECTILYTDNYIFKSLSDTFSITGNAYLGFVIFLINLILVPSS